MCVCVRVRAASRQDFDDVTELASERASKLGLHQPLIVVPSSPVLLPWHHAHQSHTCRSSRADDFGAMGTTPKRESLMSECAWREIPSTLPQDHSPSPCRCCHPLTSIIRCPPSVCCAERMSSLSPSKLSKKLTPSKFSSSKLVPSQPDQPDNGLCLTDAEADDISKQFTSAVISSALAEADAAVEAAAAEEAAARRIRLGFPATATDQECAAREDGLAPGELAAWCGGWRGWVHDTPNTSYGCG